MLIVHMYLQKLGKFEYGTEGWGLFLSIKIITGGRIFSF